MPDHTYSHSILTLKDFFDRSTRCLDEADSEFAPKPEMLTVAQHVAHVAQTVEWFVDGAFNPKGLPHDFEAMGAEVDKVKSLRAAREWLERACQHALAVCEKTSARDWMQPIGPGIMGGAPRSAIFEAMADHSAHHRGSLAVYARLLGKKPAMPYMD
jgi:uncharacterized damage-inducible protein DinB